MKSIFICKKNKKSDIKYTIYLLVKSKKIIVNIILHVKLSN